MRGRVLEGHHEAETPARATLAPRYGLFADEMELCRRDARRRWRENERPRDRVIVQVRPGALDFFQFAQTVRAEAVHRAFIPARLLRPLRTAGRAAATRGLREP